MPARHLLCLALLFALGCNDDPIGRDVEALKGADAAGRKAAADSLAGKQDPRVGKVLVRALRDPDRDVRCAAAKALATQPADEAVEPLAALLASRGLGHECAYEPLAQLHDARAVAPLIGVARGNAQALAALGAMGPVAVGPLVNALRKETDPAHAEALAQALVTAGGKDALSPLLELAKEYDRTANANAITGLGLLGDPQALPVVFEAADKGIGSAPLALARLGGPGLDNLIVRLGSPRPWQRNLALTALAQARDPAVVPLLEKGLQSTSASVAEGSAQVLADLAGLRSTGPAAPDSLPLKAEALAALERAGNEGDTRALAATIDTHLKKPDGEDTLIGLMEMHGDERLAAAFLRSKSERLHAAAAEWSRQTGRKACAADCEAATP